MVELVHPLDVEDLQTSRSLQYSKSEEHQHNLGHIEMLRIRWGVYRASQAT